MRLIDADALMKDIKSYFGDCIDKQDSEIIDNTILVHNKNISKIIKQAPTVERPRGVWETSYKHLNFMICSHCGIAFPYDEKMLRLKYYQNCPNCCADMRGEGE